MFKMKFIIALSVFISFLLITSTIKNKFEYPFDLIKKFKNYLDLESINV